LSHRDATYGIVGTVYVTHYQYLCSWTHKIVI
jgi:hypothetical protein